MRFKEFSLLKNKIMNAGRADKIDRTVLKVETNMLQMVPTIKLSTARRWSLYIF